MLFFRLPIGMMFWFVVFGLRRIGVHTKFNFLIFFLIYL